MAVATLAACRTAESPRVVTPGAPGEASRVGGIPKTEGRKPTAADVAFMTGMIPHHAQAVRLCAWAPTHGASAEVRLLCERILVSQRDEIDWMRTWLRDRGQPVPPADATHHRMTSGGVAHDMLMPGMLTDEQLAELDRARGADWDRLFLLRMIAHHEGALKMADDLFKIHGAVQGDDVYKFVSDLQADQEMEIERMRKMLEGGPEG
jgi:uncharacterized protein (DUF305 family)